MQNLMKTFDHINAVVTQSFIRGNYVILLTLHHFHYLPVTRKAQNIKLMTHLKVFCWNIFKEIFQMWCRPLHTCAIFFTFKSHARDSIELFSYFCSKAFFRIQWSVIGQSELAEVSWRPILCMTLDHFRYCTMICISSAARREADWNAQHALTIFGMQFERQ